MLDATRLYDLIYALAATDGREQMLFGSCAPLARKAFERSCACAAFPELWFELPLAGEPWFDLHVLTHRSDVSDKSDFSAERCGGHPEIFAWFARSVSTRQLALSYDVSTGDIDHPAVQLLLSHPNTQSTCDFLSVAGADDVIEGYRAFLKRMPQTWYACYTGVFPGRALDGMRVECLLRNTQQAYAQDPSLLRAHLAQVGLTEVDDEMLGRLHTLAQAPWPLEFQFDVDANGFARDTFSASLRFPPMPTGGTAPYGTHGACGELMRTIEAWGLADGRWQTLAQTAFAKGVRLGDEAQLISCCPVFVKLKWRGSTPIDCKSYLVAGVHG